MFKILSLKINFNISLFCEFIVKWSSTEINEYCVLFTFGLQMSLSLTGCDVVPPPVAQWPAHPVWPHLACVIFCLERCIPWTHFWMRVGLFVSKVCSLFEVTGHLLESLWQATQCRASFPVLTAFSARVPEAQLEGQGPKRMVWKWCEAGSLEVGPACRFVVCCVYSLCWYRTLSARPCHVTLIPTSEVGILVFSLHRTNQSGSTHVTVLGRLHQGKRPSQGWSPCCLLS